MAIIKCKMCGGDLLILPGSRIAECQHCYTQQTVPDADDEKKLLLFERAERLRKNCEFDKAAGVYESIVADFTSEAEAYWGLVLCRYGIEYVDDPNTGKKVPTCHRSSFEPVMDDPDLIQALENVDAATRRVYREEAKTIEELRKGIIEISAKEEPYDIFICYKETAENGQRTLDSVLAQDVYDELTDRGYRVFFSRISLEDKLGMEYEPYIFAALNSAKVMLVFGTDYEYFHAVWVKNEWSRFLNLMTKDKSKHLIPCFKGIDAYDMPREFARLQAQDLGKVGAVQDLLRGIEKLLPRKVAVDVGAVAAGQGTIRAFLDRGFMSLSDGEWQEAADFFNSALNMEAHCAEAYLGQFLAENRCRDLDAYEKKVFSGVQMILDEEAFIYVDASHKSAMIEKLIVPGYMEADRINELYDLRESYKDYVPGIEIMQEQEIDAWKNSRNMSYATQYATGETAEKIQKAFAEITNRFASISEERKAATEEGRQNALKRLESEIAKVDMVAEEEHANCERKREADYQQCVDDFDITTDVDKLEKGAITLEKMRDYKESAQYARKYRQKLEKIQAELRAKLEKQQAELRAQWEAEERERERQEKALAAKRAVKRTIRTVVILVIIAAGVLGYMGYKKVYLPGKDYAAAERAEENGNIAEAAILYGSLGSYKDSLKRSMDLWEQMGMFKRFSCNISTVYAIGEDGKILSDDAGNLENDAVMLPREWEGVKSILGLDDEVFGILEDGSFLYAEDNSSSETWTMKNMRENKMDMSGFIKVITGPGNEEIYLRNDGTAYCSSLVHDADTIMSWDHLIDICATSSFAVGLRSDHKLVISSEQYNKEAAEEICSWENVVKIATVSNGAEVAAVISDGSVRFYAYDIGSYCLDDCDAVAEIAGWTDIVQVAIGRNYVAGLKSDGTVVITSGARDTREVTNWENIAYITVCGSEDVFGVTTEGKVVHTNFDQFNDFSDVDTWEGIRVK